MPLTDKVVLVTGSTTGIGEAIARRCVQQGARVMLHGRDVERGTAIANELGSQAAFHAEDLSEPTAPPRVIEAALKAFGKLDGLVNNAAWVVRSDIDSTNAQFFDQVMAINVRAPLMLIKAALPHLKQTEGSIVNIGSINGYTGEAHQLDYSISKGGLMTLSRNLANYLAQDRVRVTHFNVGWVITPNEYQLKMREGLPAGWPETRDRESVPSGKMTQPEDIATHAAFWLSDDSRPITGSVMELEQYPIIGRIPVKEGDRPQ
jgi:NAD(P)-dependent dehydrogenase (short-subunit alcohol dehydrogenase family)